jgi:hypothetical protein
MSKTIVSAFANRQETARLVNSVIACGFDSRLFSVINSAENNSPSLDSVVGKLPSLQEGLYRNRLRSGGYLFVARVSEDEVQRLIKLLQSTGGHDIEAFDQMDAP